MHSTAIKRALISVSNKIGIVDFAAGLIDLGVEIYSTGGTRNHLLSHGLEVHDISQYTQFPEMMDGRVKTLHPKIFAGILCRHSMAEDRQMLADHDILPFDLVVVNLYPFAATIARSNVVIEEAIEQIDIGGPSLIRAAAKNSEFVTVVCDPGQYHTVLEAIKAEGNTLPSMRRSFMAQAFQHTANYDRTIAEYLAEHQEGEIFPAVINLSLDRKLNLRYGENNHQHAAIYAHENCRDANLINARLLNGKPLSYNNLLDLNSALEIVRSFDQPACAVIKHNNPCGAAIASELLPACQRAFAGDPTSAFGGVIGINRELDTDTANFLSSGDFFIEAIVAPDFSVEALKILTSVPKWKKNVRLVKVGGLLRSRKHWEYRHLLGGLLVQEADNQPDQTDQWQVVTEKQPDLKMMQEFEFGWQMVRYVKSNAITLSQETSLVGVGAGQMSRVDSVEIAIRKAGSRSQGSVLASDAFFPFPDSIELAAQAGIAGIIQPGGSVNDSLVIDACNRHGLPMVLTGVRHFRH